jgi:Fe-S-cluster containining protein
MSDDHGSECPDAPPARRTRRFECQRCGICCSHKGLIQPSEQNLRELARFLRISEWSLAIRYLQEVYNPDLDAYILAFRTNNPHDSRNGCIFHFGRFCAIYESCRTDLCYVFPWNHFSLEKGEWAAGFVTDEGTSWCKGIGKGRSWPLEEIAALVARYKGFGFGFPTLLDKAE